MPTSCAALCTKLAELAQRIDDELAQAGSGAAIDYGALEQRVADALGEVERGLLAQVLARLDIDVPAIRVWEHASTISQRGAAATPSASSSGDPGRGEDRKRERPERGADMAQLIGGSPPRLRGASNPASPQRNLPAGGGAADRVCRSFPARRDRSARALY